MQKKKKYTHHALTFLMQYKILYSHLDGMLIMVSPGLGATDSRRRGSRRAAHRPLLPTCCCDVAGIAPAGRHKHKGSKISDYPNQNRAVFTLSSSCTFFSGPHPPDALLLQEKRERERERESVWEREGQEGGGARVVKKHSNLQMAQDRGSQRCQREGWSWGHSKKWRCMICCDNISQLILKKWMQWCKWWMLGKVIVQMAMP